MDRKNNMARPKLIVINGFAAAGKTTIAKMYIAEHPLAIAIESDDLIVNIGDWQANEGEARRLVFLLIKSMMRAYLVEGRDVVLPYLVTNAGHVDEFEKIAKDLDADFYEFALHNDQPTAIAKLLKRGTWGEAGQPPIADDELPVIEELVTKMEQELEKRPGAIRIDSRMGDPKGTYGTLKGHLER